MTTRRITPALLLIATGAGATIIVVCSSFVLSFAALVTVGEAAGFGPDLSFLYPVSLDGLLSVGMVAAVVLRSARARTRAYVWAVISVGIAASVVGNSLHATGGGQLVLSVWQARGAGAVPPLALAASLHLLIVMGRHHLQDRPEDRRTEPVKDRTPAAPDTGPDPDPDRPAVRISSDTRTGPTKADRIRTLIAEDPTRSLEALAADIGSSVRYVRKVRATSNGHRP